MHFNSQVSSEVTESSDTPSWTDCSKRPPYFVGDEVSVVLLTVGHKIAMIINDSTFLNLLALRPVIATNGVLRL